MTVRNSEWLLVYWNVYMLVFVYISKRAFEAHTLECIYTCMHAHTHGEVWGSYCISSSVPLHLSCWAPPLTEPEAYQLNRIADQQALLLLSLSLPALSLLVRDIARRLTKDDGNQWEVPQVYTASILLTRTSGEWLVLGSQLAFRPMRAGISVPLSLTVWMLMNIT